MVKKTVDDDVSFDSIDFDSSLDVGEFDDFHTETKTGTRAVVEGAKQSFLSGVKQGVTDTSFVRRLVGLTMPKGYSQLFNAYDGTRDAVKQIYTDNEGELRPHLAKANRLLNQRKSRWRSLLPKSLRDAMDSAEYYDNQSASSQSSIDELGGNLESLDKLFKLETDSKVEQRIEDQRKEVKSDKQFQLGINTQTDVAAGIGRLVTYQDKILINYHRKSLEIGYRQFDVQRRLLISSDAFYKDAIIRLDAIQKNSAMPDYVKLNHSEAIKDRLRQRLADAAVGGLTDFRNNYFKRITEGVSGTLSGVLSMGSMASGMGSGISKAEMAGTLIGQQLSNMVVPRLQQGAEHLADIAAPVVDKIPGIKDTGNELRMFFADPQGALNRLRHTEDTGTGIKGMILSTIKSLLPSFTPADKITGLGVESLGDSATFDNLFYTSVTQIVPAYLESMDKSLRSLAMGSEQESQAWSHYTGGMVTRSTLDDQHLRIGVFRGQGQNIRTEVSNLLGKLGADELTPEASDVLARRMLVDLQKGQGFEPKDYVKPDSWIEADENVADELIEFFSEKFDLDNDGKFIGTDKSFLAEMKEAFRDSSDRIPKSLERAQVLSERVMGRDVFRRLGLSQYDGFEGDQINSGAWTNAALGEDPVTAIRPARQEDVKPQPKATSLKEQIKQVPEAVRQRLREEEEKERNERIAAKLAGKNDVIDTVQRPYGSITPITSSPVRPTTQPSTSEPRVAKQPTIKIPDITISDLKDVGTHERLDAILKRLNDMGEFTSGTSIGDTLSQWATAGSQKVGEGYRAGKAKAKALKESLQDKATHWYQTSPKVREVVTRIETKYGEITDPELRAKLIEAIYQRTGTPEEIYAYFSEKFEHVKTTVVEMAGQAKDVLTEKVKEAGDYTAKKYSEAEDWITAIYADRERYKAKVDEKYQDGKAWTINKVTQAKDTVKQTYDRREEIYTDAKEKLHRFSGNVKDTASEVKSAITTWLERKVDFGGLSDKGTHERLDVTNQLLQTLLESGLGGGGEGRDTPSTSRSWLKRGMGLIGDTLGLIPKAALGVFKGGLWTTKKTLEAGAGLATTAYGLALGDTTWGIRDVHVVGEKKPRLRAVDIRNGRYVDKATEKVISKLSDITGAVIDIRTGNEVISEEEFQENTLVDGKGDSLTMYLGRKVANLGIGTVKLATSYTLGAFGLMGGTAMTVMRLAKEVIKDQFTQFDAYFPGEVEPRIRSSLLKQGYYRDEKGGVISSLKEMEGPVYDIDGNVVISKDDWEKYKSLYARNGSLLFTIGRGMASMAGWGIKTALNLSKAIMAPGIALLKGGYHATVGASKWAINKVVGLFKGKSVEQGGVNNPGSGFAEDILLEQLRIQIDILETLRKRQKSEDDDSGLSSHLDNDGDGVKDNSWADILAQRQARRAKSPNADVVEAINSLGSRLEDNLDGLKDSVESSGKGEGVKGVIGNMWDKIKQWGSGAAGALGLKKLFGGAATTAGTTAAAGKGSLGMRILKGTGRVAWGGTKLLAKGLWKTGSFAVRRIAVPLVVTTAKVVVAAVGLPVVLAGVAIGGIGYLGYKAYKNAKFEKKPLYHLRMVQYGVKPSDENDVEKLLQLESLLSGAIKGIDTAYPDFDPSKVDMRKIYQIFGLLPIDTSTADIEEDDQAQNDPEIDPERQAKLVRWLAYRFKPVYLKHCSALNRISKVIDLNKVDDLITTKSDTMSFLDTVHMPELKKVYNEVRNLTPFDDQLSQDADDVLDMLKRCRKLAQKRPEKPEDATADKGKDTSAEEVSNPERKPQPKAVDTPIPTVVKPVEAVLPETPQVVQPLPKADGTPVEEQPPVVRQSMPAVTRRVDSQVMANLDLQSPAEISNAMVKRAEQANIESIAMSSNTSIAYLAETVNKLTSIDITLKDIADSVKQLPVAMKGNAPIPQRNTVEKQVVPGFELSKMTGADLSKQVSNKGAQFTTPNPRGNISSKRLYAVT